MNETHQRKIDWLKSSVNVAHFFWGLGTYIALLAGIMWASVAIGRNHPWLIAITAVWLSTSVNWAVWASIERRHFSR